MRQIMLPREVDVMMAWRPGRAEKLARRGDLAHLRIAPTDEIRFDREEVQKILRPIPALAGPLKLLGGVQ